MPGDQQLSVTTYGVEGVGVSADHLCIMWCNQLVAALSTTLYALAQLHARGAAAPQRMQLLRGLWADQSPARLGLRGAAGAAPDPFDDVFDPGPGLGANASARLRAAAETVPGPVAALNQTVVGRAAFYFPVAERLAAGAADSFVFVSNAEAAGLRVYAATGPGAGVRPLRVRPLGAARPRSRRHPLWSLVPEAVPDIAVEVPCTTTDRHHNPQNAFPCLFVHSVLYLPEPVLRGITGLWVELTVRPRALVRPESRPKKYEQVCVSWVGSGRRSAVSVRGQPPCAPPLPRVPWCGAGGRWGGSRMQLLPTASSNDGLISARDAVITKAPGREVLTTTSNVNVTQGGTPGDAELLSKTLWGGGLVDGCGRLPGGVGMDAAMVWRPGHPFDREEMALAHTGVVHMRPPAPRHEPPPTTTTGPGTARADPPGLQRAPLGVGVPHCPCPASSCNAPSRLCPASSCRHVGPLLPSPHTRCLAPHFLLPKRGGVSQPLAKANTHGTAAPSVGRDGIAQGHASHPRDFGGQGNQAHRSTRQPATGHSPGWTWSL